MSFIVFVSCTKETKKVLAKPSISTITFLNPETTYHAGATICMHFNVVGNSYPKLLISNAAGATLITPVVNQGILKYCLPKEITTKSDIIQWKVIQHEKSLLQGEFIILPDTSKTNIETYFGPIQITAGNNDFSMLTNIPIDKYDNTLLDGTPVLIKSEFENVITASTVLIGNGVAWKNINATTKSGRILVSSSCNGYNSKQRTTIVYPAKPTDFIISSKRDHTFADGNQILELQTNPIKDEFDNIVSDGTHVNFIITATSGMRLLTAGNTLNGKAVAKLLHPEQPETWKVEAYVTGAAKSNELTIDFDAAIKDFEFNFNKENRSITIGPLTGFMGQRVADGLSVDIQITSEDNIIKNRKKIFTHNGLATLELSKEFYPSGIYDIDIIIAGIKKETTLTLTNGSTK